MKKPTVIVYSDYVHSSCSFWRSHGPLSYLAKDGHINFIEGTWDDTWTTLQFADIAFFQRPMSKESLPQIAMAKDLGLKIIIDLDDHNSIPETHPVAGEYEKRYDEGTFIKIMMMADLVLTTTKYLKDHYSMYSGNVHIVPNAINDYWLSGRQFKKTKTVFIRGGDHHEHDMYHYKDAIIDVMNNNQDWTLEVCGSNPIFLQQEVKNYKYAGDYNMHDYFAYILQSKASIFAVPLMDNKLNRGKSNISWQEATLSGACALTPDWFGLSGEAERYNDVASFGIGLSLLINREDMRQNLYKKSFTKLKDTFLLTKVNKQRLELIKSVL